MTTHEIFDSAVRSTGDLAGVFEYDGTTGYFYLYKVTAGKGNKVLDSIHIVSGDTDFIDADISIQWDSEEQKVGLFIRNVLWAVYDTSSLAKYGGNYVSERNPSLPSTFEFTKKTI